MTGSPHPFDDDRLARRLRSIDPARDVAPLTHDQIEEIVMSTPSTETAPLDVADRPVPRRRIAVGALAAVAAAAAIVVGVTVAQPTPEPPLALTLPDTGGVAAACMPVAPEFIADSDVAFQGRVTSIEGAVVTLEVTRQFAGAETERVEIAQPEEGLSELTIGPLEVGGEYLISATDGRIATCGLSGVVSPELETVYEAAFS